LFIMVHRAPRLSLFPYTTLFRSLFAQGLHEPLGLNYINGDIYLAQRAELTRLRDLDGDGEADEYHTVYSWPLAGNYHEYVYGPVDRKSTRLNSSHVKISYAVFCL